MTHRFIQVTPEASATGSVWVNTAYIVSVSVGSHGRAAVCFHDDERVLLKEDLPTILARINGTRNA